MSGYVWQQEGDPFLRKRNAIDRACATAIPLSRSIWGEGVVNTVIANGLSTVNAYPFWRVISWRPSWRPWYPGTRRSYSVEGRGARGYHGDDDDDDDDDDG